MNGSLPYSDNVTASFPQDNVTVSNVTEPPTFYEDEDYTEYTGFEVSLVPYVITIDVITCFGVIGNILIIFIMMSQKMRHHSYAIYMIFLAVFDSLVLITIATEDTLDHIFNRLRIFINTDVILCKFWYFCSLSSPVISPWLLVAMTFDRYIVVVFPLQKFRVCSKKCAAIACTSICVVGICLVSPLVYYFEFVETDEGLMECDYKDEASMVNIAYYYMTTTTMINSFLPVCALAVLNIHTTIVLRRASASTLRRTKTGQHSLTETKLLKITMSLLLVSSLSAIALIPFAITALIEMVVQLIGTDHNMIQLLGNLWRVFNIVRLLNYAMNFYVLIIFFEQYRSILCMPCAQRRLKHEESSGSNLSDGKQVSTSTDISTDGL